MTSRSVTARPRARYRCVLAALTLTALTGCASYTELDGDPAASAEPGYPAYTSATGEGDRDTAGAGTHAPEPSAGGSAAPTSGAAPTTAPSAPEPSQNATAGDSEPEQTPSSTPSGGPGTGSGTGSGAGPGTGTSTGSGGGASATPTPSASPAPVPSPTPSRSTVTALLRVDAWEPVCGTAFAPPSPGNRVDVSLAPATITPASLAAEATLTSHYDNTLAEERYAARLVLISDGTIVALGGAATPTTAVPVPPGGSVTLPSTLDLTRPCPTANTTPGDARGPASERGGTENAPGGESGTSLDAEAQVPTPVTGLAPGPYAAVVIVEVVRDGASAVVAVSDPVPVTIP